MRAGDFFRAHRLEVFIFALALLARLVYFGISLESRGGDLVTTISGADCYYMLSENILHGNGYSCDSEPPYSLNAVRPPVYPFFIVLTRMLTGSYWGVILLQILIASLLPLIAMRIAFYLFGSRRISCATGVLLALEPFSILFAIFFYSETLFMFFFSLSLLSIFAYFKTGRVSLAALSAALLGISVLTKPTVQYVFVVIMISILLEARKHLTKKVLLTAAGYGVIFFLVVSPWLMRNYAAFGSFALSPQKEVNVYSILVPSVLAIANHTTFQIEYAKIVDSGALDPNFATFAGTKDYVKMAIPVFAAHPAAFVALNANTALNFFIHDGLYDVLKHIGLRPEQPLGKPALFIFLSDPGKIVSYVASVITKPALLILFGRILWTLITLAFFLGVWRYARNKPQVHGILATTIVLYFLLTTLVVGLGINARYRMPVNGIILAFASYEAFAISAWLREKLKKNV